jgi:4'-phosphopantetheinyl transferase EntD
MSYQLTIKNALPHGIIAGVALPGDGAAVPGVVLDLLHPSERGVAEGMRGYRQCSFVGGRLAARAAMQGLGRSPAPVLPDPRGAPLAPDDLSVSISHKNHLAVAIVARSSLGSLGIDLEVLSPARPGIARRVLRPEELAAVEALPEDRQWTGTVVRFAIKEAIYKALAPRQKRYIGFEEASVAPGVNGDAEVTLHLAEGPHPASLEARYTWLDGAVLATVRATWPGDHAPAPDTPDR